jgi:hypothetical protein
MRSRDRPVTAIHFAASIRFDVNEGKRANEACGRKTLRARSVLDAHRLMTFNFKVKPCGPLPR